MISINSTTKKRFFELKVFFISLVLLQILSIKVYGEEKSNIDKLINLALDYNYDLQIAKLNLDNSSINYRRNKSNNLFLESRYNYLENKLEVEEAKREYLETKNGVIIDLIYNYLQLVEENINIAGREKRVELEERLLNNIKIDVKGGYKGEVDLLEKQIDYNNEVFELRKAKDDYHLLLSDLEAKVGSTKEEIEITEVNIPKLWELTKEDIVAIAKANNKTLKLREGILELREIDLKRAKVMEVSKLDLKELRNNKEIAKLNYNKEYDNVVNQIKESYAQFEQGARILELREKQLKQIKDNYNIIKEQRSAEIRSQNDILGAQINLKEAKYHYQGAITNYYLSKLNLMQVMGLEIGGLSDEKPSKE
ncbi:TolC family protein [Halonatronum saccharophilum]|uniref:TolC family protein n=1 Tax=Halonatronum saccharophilum TaxID=150060 RepID=UPI0004889333|nr:TolC family protein [Halonatronum saccharophilum]